VSAAPPPSATSRRWWLAIALVTVAAAVLRLIELQLVPEDLYYDAAVRSMTLSLHNFLYGAFDPTASASIDKPPIDLWLQVISVKIFGWGSFSLKLPEALAGIAAVPLLFDLTRRVAGPLAALVAATTLTFLPTSVVTARSDTMDSVMMLLLLAVAWLLLRGAQRGQLRWLIAAALALGFDFNVKLFEALVPLPAFLVFVWLCWRGVPLLTRARRLIAATAAFAAVALAWLVFVSLTPAHDRPYPIGSTNGSVWNAVFVYNGLDRITQAPQPRSFSTVKAAAAAPVAHAAAAAPAPGTSGSTDRINSVPGPFRLFQYSLVGYGTRIGTLLFAAMLFGLVALAPLLRRRLRPPPQATRAQLIAWAAALAVAVWLLTGYVLFSFAGRTQPRYLEAFTPAIAIALGCGVVALVRRGRDLFSIYVLLATFAIAMLEGAYATAGGKLGHLAIVVSALLALPVVGYVAAGFARATRMREWPRWYRVELAVLGVMAALLAEPVVRDALLIRDRSSDQAAEVTLASSLIDPINRFLVSHDTTEYEVAATAPTLVAPMIVADPRPVLLLTSVDARPLVTLAQLRRAAAQGKVRYVFNHGSCAPPIHTALPDRPACSDAMRWVRAHARDITGETGLPAGSGLLYDLDEPPAK